ncbi:RimJ/RimL family protein N-acetyltransferase [Kribbella aluminosa]|uniref:RimJ/RimL family protein N-acetyltransferase n=1 Tax=Kribbella aluminosa TaxID=416017 RepID=A0ABS4UZB4_9ACTN|nr:hypothetical protein [Kribbella aluminosa]MBP2356977.1 RimJ/RimL family protein N-acetyltransferase [Kribbella aluminosa]
MTDLAYKPTLTGDLVVLHPMDESDYDALAAALDDPEVARFTGSHGDIGEERAREWMPTRNDQTDRLDLRVQERACCGTRCSGTARWVDEIVMSVVATEWIPSRV